MLLNLKKMTNWKIEYDIPEVSQELIEAYNPLLARILTIRGYGTPEAARQMITCSEDCVHDALLLKGMKEAVERIRLAIANREKIAVFGDYDVDGITSTSLVTDYLRSRGLEVTPYIPNRNEEGYGLNIEALKAFHEEGISLVITVDCGITACEEAKEAKACGLDLIITDHHECKTEEMPETCVVIDPKQPGDNYPFKDLAGVGVAFKLISAVEGDWKTILEKYCDLVAVGTVADVMQMTGENRYFVKKGLKKLNDNPRAGFKALFDRSLKTTAPIESTTIGFTLAPRINAAGRIGDVLTALELVLCEDSIKAGELAQKLCDLNSERQRIEKDIWEEADRLLIENKFDRSIPIVLHSETWDQGVIGIAASRLAEKYKVPTIMIHLKDGRGKGSCRSYGSFNLFKALDNCKELLETFGGHSAAAGLNIAEENIEQFKLMLYEYYRNNSGCEDLPDINCEILIDDPALLNVSYVDSLKMLEPYGQGNSKPVMCISDVPVSSISTFGANNQHIKFCIHMADRDINCIAFSHSLSDFGFNLEDNVDIAFTPEINNFRGNYSVQLNIISARKHNPSDLCRMIIEDNCCRTTALQNYEPLRKDFADVWRRLDSTASSVNELIESCPDRMSPEKYCICLKVFSQAGLLSSVLDGKANKDSGFTDLNATEFMREFGWEIKRNDKQ